MKKYFKRFAMLIGVVAIAGAAFVAAGCGRGGAGGEADFDIPASLVDRMRVFCNAVRNKMAGGVETLDGEEMMALVMLGNVSPFHVSNDEVSKTRWKPWASGRS